MNDRAEADSAREFLEEVLATYPGNAPALAALAAVGGRLVDDATAAMAGSEALGPQAAALASAHLAKGLALLEQAARAPTLVGSAAAEFVR